jgi:hypothetical protein
MTDRQDQGHDPGLAAAAGVTYDAFLSHDSADKPAVTELAHRLREAGPPSAMCRSVRSAG